MMLYAIACVAMVAAIFTAVVAAVGCGAELLGREGCISHGWDFIPPGCSFHLSWALCSGLALQAMVIALALIFHSIP